MYLIGIDSSTTATKSLIIDADGKIVAVAAAEYPFETPHPLWSEQHPDLWWDGTVQSMRAALDQSGIDPAQVAAVGVSGQMHGLVLLDEDGEPLRPAILWNDQRTGKQCDDMRLWLGKENLVRITGNDALTGFTAPKILWVKENEPDIYSRVRQILLPKDYVRYKLTGDFATDKAGAGGTSLLELATRDWSPTVLAALEIPPKFLPPTHEGTQVTGAISAQAAAATGLRAGTPVVGGGGRSIGPGRGRGRDRGGHRRPDPGHLRRRLRHRKRAFLRTGGTPACLPPRTAEQMASDGSNALGRRQLALAPRYAGARRGVRRPAGPGRRPAYRQRRAALSALSDR